MVGTLANKLRSACGVGLLAALSAAATGCLSPGTPPALPPSEVPRELDKVTMPEYRVEPPDILLIEAIRAVPKPPHIVEPLDVLFIQLANPIKDEPLTGLFTVEPDGTVNLGVNYGGTVKVGGMPVEQAREVIETHLKKILTNPPRVSVSLAQSRAAQRITGPHLVRQDGTISLGSYGSVRVVGLTLAETKKLVESTLSQSLQDPLVEVEVQGFNSKVYYIIFDGGGAGQQVYKFPITGNETVLDAVANANGLSPVSSTHRIWVARPAPAAANPCQMLPVDWKAVSTKGDPTTNYQLLPGDRLYIDAQPAVTFDTYLARFLSPIERVLNTVLLGYSTDQYLLGRTFNGTGAVP
jgi:polysaccharide export outer membrane protein